MSRTAARTKFMKTPARTTPIRDRNGLEEKLPGSLRCSPSSPSIFTNPPKGMRLTEYTVPPRLTLQTRGGKPKPSSSTRIPDRLATKKCPNSWVRTRTLMTIMKISTVVTMLGAHEFLFFLLGQDIQILIDIVYYLLQLLFGPEHLVLASRFGAYLRLHLLEYVFPYLADTDARFFHLLVQKFDELFPALFGQRRQGQPDGMAVSSRVQTKRTILYRLFNDRQGLLIPRLYHDDPRFRDHDGRQFLYPQFGAEIFN